jgi:RNA polymerase sigma factor for flagellar operon FliA
MKQREQLSPEETALLWDEHTIAPTDESKRRLMMQYIGLVRYVINNLNLADNSVLSDDDFLHIGILGLNEAIERFEASRGIKFETYAVPRIRGMIIDEVRKTDVLSRTARKRAQDYLQASDQLRGDLGREATQEEIRQKLNISPEEYKVYLRAAAEARATLSLNDTPIQTDEDDTPIDQLSNVPSDDTDALENIGNEERSVYIARYLQNLPERQRLVMTLYYYESLTLKEIGQMLTITESRVSQIHSAVVTDLRKKLTKYF